MGKIAVKIIFSFFLILGLILPVLAEESAPPKQNPHPPQSAEDKRRVDFAVEAIRAQHGPSVEIKHPHIIPWSFEKFLQNRRPVSWTSPAAAPSNPGKAQARLKSAQREPDWTLKPNEYIVHAYVKFPKESHWRDMNVILAEDGSGKLLRRGLRSAPLPLSPEQWMGRMQRC